MMPVCAVGSRHGAMSADGVHWSDQVGIIGEPALQHRAMLRVSLGKPQSQIEQVQFAAVNPPSFACQRGTARRTLRDDETSLWR